MLDPDLPPVLLVADSGKDVETLREVMRTSGFPHDMVHAGSGDQGLAPLRENGRAHVRPALIPRELNSYGLNGRETWPVLKAEPALKGMQVTVLTTTSDPEDLAFCYRMGVNPCHVKPLRHNEHRLLLRNRLNDWLRSGTFQPTGVLH